MLALDCGVLDSAIHPLDPRSYKRSVLSEGRSCTEAQATTYCHAGARSRTLRRISEVETSKRAWERSRPMLEHIPHWLGAMLRGVRAGGSKLSIVQSELGGAFGAIGLSSPAFADRGRLPERFTADGEGVSPPLAWGELPEGTRSLALVVEDPDAPMPNPLVHAIVWGLPRETRGLDEGAIIGDGRGGADGRDVGRNSLFSEGWLPPDPPTGHGVHDYVFQLFALAKCDDPGDSPGRSGVISAMAGKVLAAGMLVGTYSRGERRPMSPDDART